MAEKYNKNRGLGRGLSALLADLPDEKASSSSLPSDQKLPIHKIVPNPDQPRRQFDEPKGKGHKEAIETFLSYVKGESNNPYTWLELRSVAKAAIYSQDYMNSGSQHSIFS